jgi:penicillin-binding protein-related factor A (putative recombinase)
MRRKQAEEEFATLCSIYNIWAHKWRDVSYCPNCHRPVFMTIRKTPSEEKENDYLQNIVDYLCFIDWIPMWVECKQGERDGSTFPFTAITDKQVEFMRSWNKRQHHFPMVFLLMADKGGRAPDGRSAYFMNWATFDESLTRTQLAGHKSWPYRETNQSGIYNTEFLFKDFKLEWRNGTWNIPESNVLNMWCKTEKVDLLNLPPLK